MPIRSLFLITKMAVLDALEYRADILMFTLASIVRPLILLCIWLAIAVSGGKAPLTTQEFIQYYLMVLFIGTFTSVWGSTFIAADIRYGKLSPHLLKPFSYLIFHLGNNFGEKVIKLVYTLPLIIFLWWILKVPMLHINVYNLTLFTISLATAIFLNFLIDFSIGLFAFWFDEANAFDDFMDLLNYIFSGKIIPLIALPLMFQFAATFLPFRYTLSFPLELLTNKLNSSQIVLGFVFQSGWLLVSLALYKILWSFGIKKYSAYGA